MRNLSVIEFELESLNLDLFDGFLTNIHGVEKSTVISPKYVDKIFLVLDGKEVVCRGVLYLNPYHNINGKAVACIGYFEALDDLEAVSFLFENLSKYCLEKGIDSLLGPMDGSTWNSYRFALKSDFRPYFLEPNQPDYYPDLFEASGFEIFQSYSSAIDEDIASSKRDVEHLLNEYKSQGLVMRNINLENIDAELTKIGHFTIDAFKENLLYSPIDIGEFLQKYKAIVPYLKPEYILMAENKEGELHGLLFAIPDHLDPSGNTIIFKTLARKKTSPFKGLSPIIYNHFIDTLAHPKEAKIVHALMADSNVSLNISKNYHTTKIRSYNLYLKNLKS